MPGAHPDRRRREEHPRRGSPTEYRALAARPARLDDWWARIDGWRREHPLRYDDSTDAEIKPQCMVEALYEATGGDAIVTSDVGQHQMWTAQYYHFRQPAPLDQLRRPRDDGLRPARGDGRGGRLPGQDRRLHRGRRLDPDELQELATCAENGIPVKVFIMNNGYLGMVRQWQELFWDTPLLAGRHGRSSPTSSSSPRPTAPPACGFEDKTTLVEDMQARRSRRRARSSSTSASPREENIYPMIPPGAAARDMVG